MFKLNDIAKIAISFSVLRNKESKEHNYKIVTSERNEL